MANDLAATLQRDPQRGDDRRAAERPLRPPRPAARPAVDDGPGVGDDRRQRRASRSASAASTIVDADDTTGVHLAAGARHDSPGGKLGALLDLQRRPAPIDSFRDRPRRGRPDARDERQRVYNTGAPARTSSPTRRRRRPAAIAVDVTAATVTTSTGSGAARRQRRRPRDRRACTAATPTSATPRSSTRIGNDVATASAREGERAGPDRHVKDRRESVSGVSLDEEMTNIIRFQRAYQASARAMSTIDEMLDTLINRAGRVGL